MTYVLEVLRRGYVQNSKGETRCFYEHLGYMKKTFDSLYSAKEYYNKNNETLPKLSTKLLISSVNEETNLLYIIRECYPGIRKTIDPFETNNSGDGANEWCFV